MAAAPVWIGCGAAAAKFAVPASMATAAMAKSEGRGPRRLVRMVVDPGGTGLAIRLERRAGLIDASSCIRGRQVGRD